MSKHKKTEDLNKKPFDSKAEPEVKAEEFDHQWGQNHQYNSSPTPMLDAYEGKKKK